MTGPDLNLPTLDPAPPSLDASDQEWAEYPIDSEAVNRALDAKHPRSEDIAVVIAHYRKNRAVYAINERKGTARGMRKKTADQVRLPKEEAAKLSLDDLFSGAGLDKKTGA